MNRQRAYWVGLGVALGLGCGRQPIDILDGGDTSGTTGGETDSSPVSGMPDPSGPDPDSGFGTQGMDTGVLDTGPWDTSATTGASSGSCCEPHAEPGCDEPAVSECVCALNGACCGVEWDPACAAAAVGQCGAQCGGDTGVADTGVADTGVADTGVADTGVLDTGGPVACDDPIVIEMVPADATLSGSWMLSMSMVGEGEIIVLPAGQTDGTVLYEPDIPCDDTWYIWVRYWEQGPDDSYFATLDGQPAPAAIFEGDCSNFGNGWGWQILNWRDQNAGPCNYTEDLWAPAWATGSHAIELSYRESIAVGRIVVTNDPAYLP
jgi:hypothetical protein